MPDVFTQAKRSQVMSRIGSRGNRDTDLALAALFRRQGITGWRRHWEIRSPKFEVRIKSEGRKPKPGRAHPASGVWHHALPRPPGFRHSQTAPARSTPRSRGTMRCSGGGTGREPGAGLETGNGGGGMATSPACRASSASWWQTLSRPGLCSCPGARGRIASSVTRTFRAR